LPPDSVSGIFLGSGDVRVDEDHADVIAIAMPTFRLSKFAQKQGKTVCAFQIARRDVGARVGIPASDDVNPTPSQRF